MISLRFVDKGGNTLPAKRCLEVLGNMNWNFGWTTKGDRAKAKAMAESDASEEECEKLLRSIEWSCQGSLDFWRMMQ